MADNKELEKRIRKLELLVNAQQALISNLPGRIVFRKEVQFMSKVYDDDGNVVSEINP